ncbi:MAG: hypothetical protein M0Z36_08245 [Thermaerobacter sp.]|nr:hypothetical protein [Thermaerobacter sp.]
MTCVVSTIVWCALAISQAVSDARRRLLPWSATGAAGLVGLLVGWHVHALGTGSMWWIWHVGAGFGLGLLGLGLWFVGSLGLGDVAVFGVFGLLFGLVGAVAIIALSYLAMAIVVGIRWLRHQSTCDMPLGIPLWLLSIPAWVITMLLAPRFGGIL